MPATNRVERSSLRERAYVQLRREIIEGKHGFGFVLSPRRLGLAMGMSFLPVSDALARLEAEGLVETRDRVGTRVKIPTTDDVEGVFAVREALESQAARLCCLRTTAAQRRALRGLANQVDERFWSTRGELVDRKLWVETSRLHGQFHSAIAEYAACPRLRDAIEKSQVLAVKVQFDNALRRKKRPKKWHGLIMDAIDSGDPEVADRAARVHVQYSLDEVLEYVATLQVEDRWRHLRVR